MKKRLIVSITFIVCIAVVFAQDNAQSETKSIVESIRLQDVIIIWFAGMLGGAANSLLDREGWKSALILNLLLGGIAALIIYFLGGNELTPPKQVGAALLSGIGGSNIITSLRQQTLIVRKNRAITKLSDTTDRFLQVVDTATAIEEGGENNESADERNPTQETETGNQS